MPKCVGVMWKKYVGICNLLSVFIIWCVTSLNVALSFVFRAQAQKAIINQLTIANLILKSFNL